MTADNGNHHRQADRIAPGLRLVAWEITKSCNLFFAHCRSSSDSNQYSGELKTEECFRLVDQILEVGRPIIILTGGEPLLRDDVFQIAEYAVSQGLRVVMGTNGTLITKDTACQMKAIPISRVGISLDFPEAQLQDNFRGKAGAFDATLAGISNVREAGVEVQINCTVTRRNVVYLERLLSLALDVGAVAFHPFLLVPTGRGKGLESVELSPEEYERTLNWIYDKQFELGDSIFFKPTDAPTICGSLLKEEKRLPSRPQLAIAQRSSAGGHPTNAITRGCLAGTGFCFISHQGKVKGCGYLDVEAGDVKNGIVQPDLVWFPLVQPTEGPVGNQRKVRRLRIQEHLRRVQGPRL